MYDRRGHSRRPWPEPVNRRRDEDDLANLIGHIGSGRAHLVGNSYGTSIALAVASRRPDLVSSVVGHEPPLLGAATWNTQLERDLDDLRVLADEIAATIERGDAAEGAKRFTEAVLGVGAWAFLPSEIQATFVTNAATFAGMVRDPGYDRVPDLADHEMPIMLTMGTERSGWLSAIVNELAAAYPRLRREQYRGAGHIPHLTHPHDVATTVSTVIDAVDRTAVETV